MFCDSSKKDFQNIIENLYAYYHENYYVSTFVKGINNKDALRYSLVNRLNRILNYKPDETYRATSLSLEPYLEEINTMIPDIKNLFRYRGKQVTTSTVSKFLNIIYGGYYGNEIITNGRQICVDGNRKRITTITINPNDYFKYIRQS